MKTQEQKLQHVMEAAGEKWHENFGEAFRCFTCSVECHTYHPNEIAAFNRDHSNPSPDDLNELFRLAGIIQPDLHLNLYFGADKLNGFITVADSTAFAESMLDALFIATGGKYE